ncbi:hypothetical protein VP01_939g1 [Puccinia sorghi]|uniref:Uncharacterized protein n=1 Tax=Puccinia sorghi TaxID=27349 RepID=A0A0L6U6S9_9BASI|nr:hypothetical protein VP01_939g1 [Puccinia sorghi]
MLPAINSISPSSPRLTKKSRMTKSPGSSITPTKKDALTDKVESPDPCESQGRSTHNTSDHAEYLRVDAALLSSEGGKFQRESLNFKPGPSSRAATPHLCVKDI